MKRRIVLAIVPFGIAITSLNCAKVKTMTKNETNLEQSRTNAKEFQATQEPELLKEAYLALENVLLPEEDDPKERGRLRTRSLEQWLHLIQLVDDSRDPNFNADDVPERIVEPPPTSGLRPGARPALIKDPKQRAEYERAITANRKKAKNYRLQIHLGRLNERITPRAEGFILDSYTQAAADQEEVRTAIEKTIKDPRRKAKLLKLVRPAQP